MKNQEQLNERILKRLKELDGSVTRIEIFNDKAIMSETAVEDIEDCLYEWFEEFGDWIEFAFIHNDEGVGSLVYVSKSQPILHNFIKA